MFNKQNLPAQHILTLISFIASSNFVFLIQTDLHMFFYLNQVFCKLMSGVTETSLFLLVL